MPVLQCQKTEGKFKSGLRKGKYGHQFFSETVGAVDRMILGLRHTNTSVSQPGASEFIGLMMQSPIPHSLSLMHRHKHTQLFLSHLSISSLLLASPLTFSHD